MKVVVLGSGAGGGFPQWNCNCDNCRRWRAGRLRGRARTQASIAVSDGVEREGAESWVLLGASPDLREQFESFPPLQPARWTRDTALSAVVLVDAQVDQVTGLMTLRESHRPLEIYCTRLVHEDLTTGYPLLSVLEHYCGVHWHEIPTSGEPFEVAGAGELRFTALPIESNAPPFSPRRGAPELGDNVCVRIEDPQSGKSLMYAPGLGTWTEELSRAMRSCSCILVDGTVWHDDDLARAGARNKLAGEMGHLHHAGPGGLLQRLADLPGPRKILTHVNNTNPVLDEDSEQHAELRRAGVELAYDGMRLEL